MVRLVKPKERSMARTPIQLDACAHAGDVVGASSRKSQRPGSRPWWRSKVSASPARPAGSPGSNAAPAEPSKGGILITGSEGLIGSALGRTLSEIGETIIRLDLQAPDYGARGDVRCPETVRRALQSCRGVVHLAAVSRVALGERDPDLCWSTNVDGTRLIAESCLAAPSHPWLLFASSREVFGQPRELPATEETPLAPRNVYGRSKVAGERLVREAGTAGLRVAIVRFANVYGSTRDHSDRVVPAFARAAALGAPLRVEGPERTFDFIHIDDVVRALVSLIGLLDAGRVSPPINLVSGNPTTLGALAQLCVELAGTSASIVSAPPRTFEVSDFYGDPARARAILDWTPTITLREGVARLIHDFQAELARSAQR